MKFRNNRNQFLISALFKEESKTPDTVLYTLSREDEEGYSSLYKLYMEMEDFTEYDFANKYFESYQHWKLVCQTAFFAQHIAEWREELELKIRSRALKSLINKSESSTEVAKYLLNNKWTDKVHESNPNTNLRGRPSKEEIKGHLRVITNEAKQIEKDYNRIKGK